MRSSSTTRHGILLRLVLSSIVVALLILLLSKPITVNAEVFLSIDCGGSDSFTDTNSISWVGDDDYVRNGESQLVEFSSSESTLTSTLRAFPTLNKNCYTIDDVVQGQRLFVRASFYYGNYDGKNSPPTFDLYFDNHYWTKVNMSLYTNKYVAFEVIYTVNANTTSICLVRSHLKHIPFITALEFRSLDGNMYSHVAPNSALFMEQRYSQGTDQIVRYPDDAYDRLWYPAYVVGSIDVKNEATTIDVSSAEDNPPKAVLQNGNTFSSLLSNDSGRSVQYMSLFTSLPDYKIGVYMTLYFSEVTLLGPTEKRSFQLYIDGVPYSKPIIPPFGSVQEVYVTNITASSGTLFDLRPTPDSTLPPLINANEVYSVRDALLLGTHIADVEGLAILQKQFEVLQRWSGDPCLPSQYSWEWVECSTDAIPRVTALNLSDFGLFGSLPDFGSMDALITVDLHNNSLNGPIPGFLGTLTKLKLLDLSDNRFNGTVPTTLSTNKNLKLVVSENCLSGMSCPPPPPDVSLPRTPPPPPPPPSTLDFGDDQRGQNDVPFRNGSQKTAKLSIVLGVIIQFFLFGFFCINF